MTDETGPARATRRRTFDRRDLVIGGTLAGAVAILVIGFATPSLRRMEPEATRDPRAFAEDLRACRFMKGGTATQRNRAEPTDAYIAACLRRRGWAPDGAPTLESVLREGD